MTEQRPFNYSELLEQYDGVSREAAHALHRATLVEIDRVEWVNREIETMVGSGVAITRAEKDAHAKPEHRDWQRRVAAAKLEADLIAREARVLEFALRLGVPAPMEGGRDE